MKPSAAALFAVLAIGGCRATEPTTGGGEEALPAPRTSSSVSLETAIATRKPARAFGRGELTNEQVAQLLWSSRATPTMGAIPLDLYVARSNGVMRYSPQTHGTVTVVPMDVRKAIVLAGGEPEDVRDAPVLLVFVAQPEKGRTKYGDRADRFAAIEAGHAAQNVLLQATALGLSATPLVLFDDNALREALLLPKDHVPLHIVAVGNPI